MRWLLSSSLLLLLFFFSTPTCSFLIAPKRNVVVKLPNRNLLFDWSQGGHPCAIVPSVMTSLHVNRARDYRNGQILLAMADDKLVTFSSSIQPAELKIVFSKYSSDGWMSQAELKQVPFVRELLDDEDLVDEELDEIWSKHAASNNANLDAFVKICSEIDGLFEDGISDRLADAVQAREEYDHHLTEDPEVKVELEEIFQLISKEGLVSKESLRKWDEIETLIFDGMLGEDEFEDLWETTPKSKDQLDLDGFVIFNSRLDDLFDFDKLDTENSSESRQNGEETLFQFLAGESGLVSMDDLKRWGELQEMLNDGDILPQELEQLFASALAQSKDASALDELAFGSLQAAIDELFEEEEEEEENEPLDDMVESSSVISSKKDLLQALEIVNKNDEKLPCGLECTEQEEKFILNLANKLIKENSNLVLQKQGKIDIASVAGSWKLLFTSSSAMKFNKGLSGIGGSFPNGRFGGLKQRLSGSTLLPDVEYQERIAVNPSTASFDVTVNGNWELRQSVSLFTGEKSTVLVVDPDRVMYGPTSTKADHWKSLGPTNMLDLVYLDQDLRIMRGSTSVDTIFIFQRI